MKTRIYTALEMTSVLSNLEEILETTEDVCGEASYVNDLIKDVVEVIEGGVWQEGFYSDNSSNNP